jgi:hypothetical protein
MKKILYLACVIVVLVVPLKSAGTEEGCGEEGECLEGDCDNGRGIYIFSDGSSYRGEWVDGFPDGFGALQYSDGSRDEGEWQRGIYLGEREIETGAGERLR